MEFRYLAVTSRGKPCSLATGPERAAGKERIWEANGKKQQQQQRV
jgi:hypothetical protein